MSEGSRQIRHVLRTVRRRWMWHTIFACGRRAALAAAVVLLGGGLALRLLAPRTAVATALLDGAIVLTTLAAVIRALWPLTRRPSDARVARFVEERCPQLEDRLVTAVECVAQPGVLSELLYRDAALRTAELDLDRTISRRAVAVGGSLAVACAVLFAAALVLVAPRLLDGVGAARALVSPGRVFLRVLPGDATVVAGHPLELSADVRNGAPAAGPVVVSRSRAGVARQPMTPGAAGRFALTIRPSEDFTYSVSAGPATSPEYRVTVLHPPSVTGIDVHYQYPPQLALPPRTDEGGGDVYAPAGTRVQLRVHTDKPIRTGSLVAGGHRSPLSVENDRSAVVDLTVTEDSSYRVALTDADNLENPGDVEYFIRVLADTPPEVRIVTPAADRQVTPLEEVAVTAHAEDDRGLRDFDLVYSVSGGPETSVPFSGGGSGQAKDGQRVLFLEDLHVRPGDFVTYYARARDGGGGGGRGAEARSDIYFLQVTPFEQEFMPPQSSQAVSGGMSAAGHSLDDLVNAQKSIIVATWRLDRRARKSHSGGSEADVKTIGRAQGELKSRAAAMSGEPSIRVGGARAASAADGDPMAAAAEAMDRAEQSLNAVNTTAALPHETRALNELLKAQAASQRRQLMQARGGTGGDNGNSSADLTTLFDRELQRQQRTNYEMPAAPPGRGQDRQSEALERVRELAERQGELARQQDELARNRGGMNEEELKRQLERLTREQSDLRQQAEQLGRQVQSQGDSRPGTSGGRQQSEGGGRQSGEGRGQGARNGTAGGSGVERLRQASEAMREAASNLRDGNLAGASRQSAQASDRLRSAGEEMRGQSSRTGAPSLGDLQMEARQLADAQQQIAREASSAGSGKAATDTMRRLAGEKERLADKADRLGQGLKSASGSPGLDGHQRQAVDGVTRDFEHLQVAKQMRDAATVMRAPEKADVNRPPSAAGEQELANTLGRLADRLAAAAGGGSGDRAMADLDRTREMRDRLAQLQGRIAEVQRQARKGATDTQSRGSSASQESAAGSAVGTTGRGGADRTAELRRLQDEYARELRRAADELSRLGASQGGGGTTPRDAGAQSPLSAPGFHQDFSKWEELSRQVNAGLERAETTLSRKVRDEQARDRLKAPSAARAPEAYRRLVEQYYQALAKKDR